MVRGTKFSVSFTGSSQLWTLGRRLYPEGFFSGKYRLRTWCGFVMMDLNSWWLAVPANSSNVGKSGGREPARLSLAIGLSSRALSSAEVKPHHAGEAYSNEATVVAIIEPTENAGILLRVFNNFSSGINYRFYFYFVLKIIFVLVS